MTMLWIFVFSPLHVLGSAAGANDGHCELTNIALNKRTNQSSTFYDSQRAVDGDKINNSFKESMFSCSHTKENDDIHWWMVDLNCTAKIVNVTVTNRKASERRLTDFEINVSNSSHRNTTSRRWLNSILCYYKADIVPDDKTMTFPCTRTVTGQFVQIIKRNKTKLPLTLCEVEVIGRCPRSNRTVEDSCLSPPPTVCRQECHCKVNKTNNVPSTKQELEERVKTLQEEIKVNKKMTNSYKRKLVSAPDDRESSKNIGCVAIAVLIVPVLFVFAMDMSKFVTWLYAKKKNYKNCNENSVLVVKYHHQSTEVISKVRCKPNEVGVC
ncbi:uncharacterized protein [Argopecten irradians]|uniref:uncharacterized protein n=1 Tax=Argopecten irradians TaxID=31199 RepID=UPI00372319DB